MRSGSAVLSAFQLYQRRERLRLADHARGWALFLSLDCAAPQSAELANHSCRERASDYYGSQKGFLSSRECVLLCFILDQQLFSRLGVLSVSSFHSAF